MCLACLVSPRKPFQLNLGSHRRMVVEVDAQIIVVGAQERGS